MVVDVSIVIISPEVARIQGIGGSVCFEDQVFVYVFHLKSRDTKAFLC